RVDKFVGGRVRMRRKMLKLTQRDLCKAIGSTYQQIHKYETGRNRLPLGRLVRIAEVLKVPVAFFFEGAENVSEDVAEDQTENSIPSLQVAKFLATTDGLALISAFTQIKDASVRVLILELIKRLSHRD